MKPKHVFLLSFLILICDVFSTRIVSEADTNFRSVTSEIEFYDHVNCTGKYVIFPRGEGSSDNLSNVKLRNDFGQVYADWNDRMDSVLFKYPSTYTFWTESGYRGLNIVVKSPGYACFNLSDYGLTDQVSSFKSGNYQGNETLKFIDLSNLKSASLSVGNNSKHLYNTYNNLTTKLPEGITSQAIVGIAIATNNHAYYWYIDGTASVGDSRDANLIHQRFTYTLPQGYSPSDIVAIAFANNNDVYTWYRDGKVSVGDSKSLSSKFAPFNCQYPPNQSPDTLIGVGIVSNNDAYYYYKDRTFSVGSSRNAGARFARLDYVIPPNHTAEDIVDIDFANNNYVYVWYKK